MCNTEGVLDGRCALSETRGWCRGCLSLFEFGCTMIPVCVRLLKGPGVLLVPLGLVGVELPRLGVLCYGWGMVLITKRGVLCHSLVGWGWASSSELVLEVISSSEFYLELQCESVLECDCRRVRCLRQLCFGVGGGVRIATVCSVGSGEGISLSRYICFVTPVTVTCAGGAGTVRLGGIGVGRG